MDWLHNIGGNVYDMIGYVSSDETYEAVKNYAKEINDNLNHIKEAVKPVEEESGFLGVAWFDNDFWKLIFKFVLNTAAILLIVRAIYYPISKRKDYLFTYIMISMLIFVICFTLKKFDLGLGMALGLFAIFGIIRYRTDPIPIKEMTYLFIVIGVSVVNALANKKMSYVELLFVNTAVIITTYGMEKLWLLKHESRKIITYEKIDLIVPEKHEELKADIEKRTGLRITKLEIGKINFLNDTVQIDIYYFEDEQSGHYKDEGLSANE